MLKFKGKLQRSSSSYVHDYKGLLGTLLSLLIINTLTIVSFVVSELNSFFYNMWMKNCKECTFIFTKLNGSSLNAG